MSLLARKLIAVVAGILIAGVPVAGFNYWLKDLINQQIRDEVDSTARRSLTLAEGRITDAVNALERLAQSNIATCSPEHVEALRHANLGNSGIAEFSILDRAGRTLCSDLGVALRHRIVLSSETIADSDLSLDVMLVDDKPQRMVRVRRPMGETALAALVSGDLLLARVSTQGGLLLKAQGHIAMRDGTVIASIGPGGETPPAGMVSALNSNRFGISVAMARPDTALSRSHEELRFLGVVVNAVIALALFAIAILVPWRQRNNPVAELERAMRAGEFVPHYQPVVNITTGRLRGCEVLLRWRKPDGTILSPASFIPLAESSGLIVELTRNLMRKVVRELGAVCELRPNFSVGFNLSAAHFRDQRIVSDVKAIFGQSPIRLSQVMLEVTERQPLHDLDEARRVIAALQGLGVKIAIDDIGAGHSGLSYILKLGVDAIKLDKMFVDALDTESSSSAIIETLVDLAGNMKIEIIAEGVETFEQVITLRERGIQAVQGYVFAPPLPSAAFLRLLDAIDPHSTQAQEGRETRAAPFGFGYLSLRRYAAPA